MNWPLASLAVLGLALLAGFVHYERSRPPARVLALVAALAALAVVGRIAFAPIPNVKPTTDIVLLAGLTLGAGPGFAVGAVTALASNVFFGQGPWTPWQMVGWGGVGLFGALVGRVVGREPGRFALAGACGLAGAGFGVFMDLHVWTYTPGHDLASYLAVSAASLPFNLAHVFGNVAFCLVAGPLLLRALRRYRARFEFSWPAVTRPGLGGAVPLVGIVLAGALVAGLGAAPAAEASAAGDRGVRYLRSVQNPDGGFGGARDARSTQLYTGWAALGLASAGRNPRDFTRGGRSVTDAIGRTSRGLRDTGELERTILVLRASGLSTRSYRGRNLRSELLRRRRGDGSFNGLINLTSFGILALRASGEPAGSAAVSSSASWLAGQQNEDGGFGFSPRAASDVDDTGAALQAFAAAGRGGSEATSRAVAYLNRAQGADGGFGMSASAGSNAQSTAFAVQGLVAAGRNPDGFRAGGRSPLEYLRSLQARDGSVRYSRSSTQTPVWVTAQAITAFERRPFPLRPARRSRAALAARDGAAVAGARAGRGDGREAKRDGRDRARREEDRPALASEGPPLALVDPAASAASPLPGGLGGTLAVGAVTLAAALGFVALWWRRYWGATGRGSDSA